MPRELTSAPALMGLGGHATKKATVNEALKEYIQRRKRLKVLDLFGKIEFAPEYDCKKSRRRR